MAQSTTASFYVTTPIYYVTAKPHLGSLYSTLLADVAARWHKLLGEDVCFVTGTDEHGQKIAQAAAAANMTPQAFVDSFIPAYKECWEKYRIDYTHFIRTTDKAHAQAVSLWITDLLKTGDIYKGYYHGWYCTPCETFVIEVADEQETAPLCTSCARATTVIKEETYFFKLSKYQDRLLAFYAENPDFITPKERINEILSFVKSGLKDLSISRTTISWGIPFPGDAQHTVYVWADALINYMSAVGYGDAARTKEFLHWWPAQLHILGKDIVRFHAVYWPAFLMAADLALPKKLLVHGWLKIGDQKMSKSLGNAVDPLALCDTYGAEPVRYYLTRYMAITQDAEFSIADLEQKITSDLANDLGNLLNRLMLLAQKYNLSVLRAPLSLDVPEEELKKELLSMLESLTIDMQDYSFHKAYGHVWKSINQINAYFHAQEPWKIARVDAARFEKILSATAHALALVATVTIPVMPQKMEKLLAALGIILEKTPKNYIQELLRAEWDKEINLNNTLFAPTETLFQKYEPKPTVLKEEKEPMIIQPEIPAITIQDFTKIELRVGTIVDCQPVPKSDKLYALQVNFGEHGIRQILSGVKQHFTPEELIGKQGSFVFNLQPRAMVGMSSQGMMLFAQNPEGKLVIVGPHAAVDAGVRLQ